MREHNIDKHPSQEPPPAGGGHTAGPYRVESDGAEVYLVDGTGLERVTTMSMPGRGQRLRDARMMVRACNEHDELVAALAGVMRCYVGDRSARNMAGESGIVADRARAILASQGVKL